MTQEQKARAYDKALERASKLSKLTVQNPFDTVSQMMEEVFPELAENEDERIRKELITHCRNTRCVTEEGAERIAKWIAWLEKQGEQKVTYTTTMETGDGGINALVTGDFEIPFGATNSELQEVTYYIPEGFHAEIEGEKVVIKKSEQKPYGQRAECLNCQFNYAGECKGSCAMKRGEQNPVDKVESKFNAGDWISNGRYTKLIVGINSDWPHYMFNDGTSERIKDIDKKYHRWTIADAKDGDVLCYETKNEFRIFIYKNGHIHYHCHYCNGHLTTVDSFFIVEKYLFCCVHPATKEQRNQLEKAISDAGYRWNKEELKLERI